MYSFTSRKSGADNDLNEKIERYIKRAIEEKAIIYAFGERCNPKKIHLILTFILNQETAYTIFT